MWKPATPSPSKEIIHLEVNFPSNPDNVLLSELQVEIQLINKEKQIVENTTFRDFTGESPYFYAHYPIGVNCYDMSNHLAGVHIRAYFAAKSRNDLKPFPDCNTCQNIERQSTNYKTWCKAIIQYMTSSNQLELKVIMRQDAQSPSP